MASPEVLEFAKLLAPISADKPAGIDPRSDASPNSPYYKIKGARNDARAAERQAVGNADAAPPDWKLVYQLSTRAIAEQAKDLEIAAYLIEALIRLNGFAGMRDGCRLARELVEKFWEGLYPLPDPQPEPDEHPLMSRIAPLVGLNGEDAEGTLIMPISRVPITVETSVGKFALAQYNEANSLKKIADAKLLQKKLDAGAVSLEKFSRAVAETPPAFYVNLVEDLTASIAEFAKLSEDVDKRCDGHGPPKSNIQTALTAYLDVVKEVAREKLKVAAAVPTPTPGTKEDGAPAAGDQAAKPAPAGVLQNREQALESLQKVADFYRRTEPHSPVSYALDQVVRWGRMPLPELWTELIAEEAPRKNLFKQVGIKPPEDAKQPPKK